MGVRQLKTEKPNRLSVIPQLLVQWESKSKFIAFLLDKRVKIPTAYLDRNSKHLEVSLDTANMFLKKDSPQMLFFFLHFQIRNIFKYITLSW